MSALSILAEECELLTDSKYRAYITQVERALKSFDSTSEWADLISALGKLNKVLLAHVKYPVIPKRVTIGKRLAQCLHPALPSGVHMKAMETYDIIFKCIGTERLAQDLFIYTAGLFPLLSYAAMNVKPILLLLYERHFVSLGPRIKPGLNGLLLGLLPGLEEGSESYDHTNRLLEDFCECTEPSYFYTCLWECVHSCPSVRLPANTFLLAHFNKKKSMEDQIHMMGLNINLMVEAVCHAVQDTSVLVQRSLLDFLLVAFPLHNSQLTYSDMGKIVQASITVLLRRDMSLNRRFYAWLLGSGVGLSQVHDALGDHLEVDTSYFEKYSRELLVQALKCKLTERQEVSSGSNVKTAVLKPFRMLISLLDKPEIGPVILESVLLSIFRCLFIEFESSKSTCTETQQSDRRSKPNLDNKGSAYDELLKTANLLFGTFEPYFIWDYIARLFEHSCQRCGLRGSRQGSVVSRQNSLVDTQEVVAITELCQLVAFLLDIVSLETYSETQTEHLPSLLCHMTTSLTNHVAHLSDADIVATLILCTKILSKVQPTMTTPWSHDVSHDLSHDLLHGVGVAVSQVLVEPGVEESARNEMGERPLSLAQATAVNQQLNANKTDKVLPVLNPMNTPDSDPQKIDAAAKSLADSVQDLSSQQASTGNTDTASNTVTTQIGKNEVNIDTVNYAAKSHEPLSRKNSKQNKSANLMQKCIDCFQSFFHTLVIQKILKDRALAEKCYECVLINKPSSHLMSTDRDSCIDSESETSWEDRFYPEDRTGDQEPKITLDFIEDICLQTFSSACQLLVEFASFPMYSPSSSLQSQSIAADGLPAWVRDLVTCCCYVDHFQVQSAAISTMLDLIVLTQSVQVDPGRGMDQSNRPTSISILPTLHHNDLTYLADNTVFYKNAAHILWGYLGERTCQYHQQTVKLFHILHQVAPSAWVCENVIGNQLVHDSMDVRVDAFKKFTVLWHLSRHRRSGVIPGKPLRTFDRSMFVVLDSLKEESSAVKVIATTWLGHVIQHGDISRTLEPLLLMLLHPDTARVSIQHVNVHKPRKVRLSESSEDKSEANIYAISSEGGNVIYHVSQNRETMKKQKDEMKSYALTVLGERGASLAPIRSRSEQELHFEKVDPNNINMRFNPFGSENSLDTLIFGGCEMASSFQEHIYHRAKRLDKDTCKKEGISFMEEGESTQGEETDDERMGMLQSVEQRDMGSEYSLNSKQSSVSNSTESILESAEELVRGILDDVLRSAVKEDSSADESAADKVVKKPVPPRHLLAKRADSVTSSTAGENDILNLFQKHGSGIDSPTLSERGTSMFLDGAQAELPDTTDIHSLHMHMLLYMQKYDIEQTVYALSTLKSMLEACPRLLVTSLVTTNISSLRAPQLAKLQLLLARHRKSVFGKNFFGEIPSDVMSNYRSNMFIEILISTCLYFIRGYFPNLMMSKLSNEELLLNKKVHIIATETLTLILSEVLGIMRDSGANFVSYISDLLQKCKVQKAILHCILAVIYNNRKREEGDTSSKITEAIIAFNEESLDPSANETFQIKLLDLLLVMIMLEDQTSSEGVMLNEWDRLRVNYQSSLNNVRYNPGHPIVQQGMFVSSILSALKQFHTSHMHRHWIALVTAALPYMGKYLPGIVMTVVSQLCRNLEAVASEYETGRFNSQSKLNHIPPDHIVTLLNGLTTMCHYCLLDNVSPVSIGHQTPTSPGTGSVAMASSNILSNLFNVFNPVGNGKAQSPQGEPGCVSPVLDARTSILSVMPRIIACMASLWRAVNLIEQLEDPATLTMGAPKVVRQNILEFISPISLPHGTHLMGAIAVAWNDRRKKANLKAINKKVVPSPCEDQLLLVDLVRAIRVMPMDTLIQTVKQVLKAPPSSELSRAKRNVPLEVNMLQFFYAFVEKTSSSQLMDSWPALLGLLRDGLQLNLVPPGQFILVLILNEFVQKTPCMSEKKNQRDVQDIAQRLLEAVSSIAGSCLEQTTWLRKNFAVKPGLQSDEPEHEDGNQPMEEVNLKDRRVADPDPASGSPVDSKYSVQALTLLAELTAPLLDVIYSSDEKDKVSPFLITLLYNIFPYLKNHSLQNLPSLRSGSQFLASISSYQYTRKAWKKEALELLLDPSFFQMDLPSIGSWLTIIDNLMTHDKTTYKDLMARVTMTQTGSLSLFSNREQEISQKAGMLKRLAFTIFCSEPDQYQKSIPEIQEKLAESLRVLQAPSIMAQVFLCFRVLMLRVSPQHLTSMWPTIITELIHVFLQIEQELSTETDEFVKKAQIIFETQLQRIAALDSSWAHLGNGLNAHNNPSWLQLYLSACKLLDLCLTLPADRVPQFQLYRWAFIGGAVAGDGDEEEEEVVEEAGDRKKKTPSKKPKRNQFKPHIIRLARLLNTRIKGDVPILKITPGQPLLTFPYLRSLAELQPFFNTLCLANQTDNLLLAARQLGASTSGKQSAGLTNGHPPNIQTSQSQRGLQKSKSVPQFSASQTASQDQSASVQIKNNKQFIEDVLKRDFLEPMT